MASYGAHVPSSTVTVIMIHRSFALPYLVGCNAVPHYEFSILRGTDTQPGGVTMTVSEKQRMRQRKKET